LVTGKGGRPTKTGRWLRILVGAAIAALAVVALTLLWRRISERYPLVRFERTREAQRLVNLRAYAAREPLGSFLPQGDAQLAIRESLLQDILARSLPIRQKFEDGRYEARLDQALLDLGDGLASITLIGHGRMLGPDASPLEANIRLQTHIDVVDFRPDVGTLRASLAITAAHVVRARGGAAGPLTDPAARFFGSLKVEDWNRERPTLEIPIRLEQAVTLPAIEGDFSLDSCRISLALAVSALTVLQDRLVVSLALERGVKSSEKLGNYDPDWTVLSPESRVLAEKEAGRLNRRGLIHVGRSVLLRRVHALAARDSLWQGLMASDRDVVAVVPLPVLQTLCNRVARSYVQGARLDFDPNLRTHLDQRIRFRLLGGTVGAGKIVGNVRVTHLHGRLGVSGDPKLRLLPPDGLELTTPIRVLGGSGRVNLDMRWDPSFFVAIVCRGFGFQQTLTGEVVPFSHVLQTRIRFAPEGSRVVGRPVVRRDRIRVPCEFTGPSLLRVRSALLEQDKFLRCGMVMDADTVLTKLRDLVRHDVRVALPPTLFKPFRLPVGVEERYDAGDFRVMARMERPEVTVRPKYLRFGFSATLSVRPR
jgi:hypothetical protein